MPKHGKRKAKATAKPLAVPLDNKPRYSTLEVHQLPTPIPTPATKARNRVSFVNINEPLVRAKVSLTPARALVDPEALRMEEEYEEEERQRVLEEEQAAQEEDESARGEVSDKEDQLGSGPWISKGNPTGYSILMMKR